MSNERVQVHRASTHSTRSGERRRERERERNAFTNYTKHDVRALIFDAITLEQLSFSIFFTYSFGFFFPFIYYGIRWVLWHSPLRLVQIQGTMVAASITCASRMQFKKEKTMKRAHTQPKQQQQQHQLPYLAIEANWIYPLEKSQPFFSHLLAFSCNLWTSINSTAQQNIFTSIRRSLHLTLHLKKKTSERFDVACQRAKACHVLANTFRILNSFLNRDQNWIISKMTAHTQRLSKNWWWAVGAFVCASIWDGYTTKLLSFIVIIIIFVILLRRLMMHLHCS